MLGSIFVEVWLHLKLIHHVERLSRPLLIEQIHLVLLILFRCPCKVVAHGEWLKELQNEGVIDDDALYLLHQVLVYPKVVIK